MDDIYLSDDDDGNGNKANQHEGNIRKVKDDKVDEIYLSDDEDSNENEENQEKETIKINESDESMVITDDSSGDEYYTLSTENKKIELSDSESDYSAPLSKTTLTNINFESDMIKLNDIIILKVLTHFKFPLIKGWQLSSILRRHFTISSNYTKMKLSNFIEHVLRHGNKNIAQDDSSRKQDGRQPSIEKGRISKNKRKENYYSKYQKM